MNRIRLNPRSPPPDPSHEDIEDFFLANNSSLSQSQAEERATKLYVNGNTLYKLDKDAFT